MDICCKIPLTHTTLSEENVFYEPSFCVGRPPPIVFLWFNTTSRHLEVKQNYVLPCQFNDKNFQPLKTRSLKVKTFNKAQKNDKYMPQIEI